MHDKYDKKSSFSLKQKAEEFIDRLHSNPSIIQHLLIINPNAVFLIVRSCIHQLNRSFCIFLFAGAPPCDYNSLVVKSLAGNRCHAGQVCGLGSNIYSHRLRYAISDLFDIPSTNITGFTLENTNQSIEPYWPSITINGITVKLELNNNKSISNNASQDDETVRVHKYFT
jgi:malate/lactate dehydrogenase